jgi:Fe-S-cluster containining protein
MRCLHCGHCCKETEMLLSIKDIERLEQKGYEREYFARLDSKGYLTLRNHYGYCVFYDFKKKRCKVRLFRPLGCRIYPVMYDEDKGIVVDRACPAANTVTRKQRENRGKKVLKLLEKIDSEAKKRCFK